MPSLVSHEEHRTDTLLDFDGPVEQPAIPASFTNPMYDAASTKLNNQNESPQTDEQLLVEAYEQVNQEAQALSAKIDLVTSPSPPATSGSQPPPSFDVEKTTPTPSPSVGEQNQSGASPKSNTASPTKKPTASAAAKPTKPKAASGIAAPSKSTEPKPAGGASKTTEPKPATSTARRTLQSAPATGAAKTTPVSPKPESSTVSGAVRRRLAFTLVLSA